ncbi:MAG: tol-pal system YbgF family protein [Candidatus Methylomirabilales bacterium]
MRLKGPIIKPRRVTRKELGDHLYEMRRLLTLGVLVLLLLVFGWWGYGTFQGRREDAAQAILTNALQMLQQAPEASGTGEANEATATGPDQALPLFNQILEEYPSSSAAEPALLQIGHTLFAMGRYQDALVAYQRYLEKYPHGSWVFLAGLGRAYAMEAQGQYNVAASIFRSLAEQYRGQSLAVEALMGLGRSLEDSQQKDAAVAVYRRVVERYPGSSWSRQAQERMAFLER